MAALVVLRPIARHPVGRSCRGRAPRAPSRSARCRVPGWRRVATETSWPRATSSRLRSSTTRSTPPTIGRVGLGQHQDPHRTKPARARGVQTRCQNPPCHRLPHQAILQPTSISVLICAYTLDRLEVTAQAIESVRAQTLPPARDRAHDRPLARAARRGTRRWPDLTIVENRERAGPLRRAQQRRRRVRAARSSPSSTTTRSPPPTGWSASARPTATPTCSAPAAPCARPGSRASRAGSRPSSTGWSAAPTPGCRRSARRCATWSAPTCPSGARRWSRSAVSATSWAGSGRCRPAARRPTSASASASAGPRARSSTTPPRRSNTSFRRAAASCATSLDRCRGEGRSKAVLAGLVGSDAGLAAERSYVPPHAAAGRPARSRRRLRGDAGGVSRAAMIVIGLAATTRDYLRVRYRGRRQIAPSDAAPRAANGGGPRVLMVTPRSPLSQGGVERHVMEVSRRMAAAGAAVEVLCTDPAAERRGGAARRGHDPHRPRLARGPRLVLGAADLARDVARRSGTWSTSSATTRFVAPLAMLRALVLGVPYVVTFHGGGHSSEAAQPARAACSGGCCGRCCGGRAAGRGRPLRDRRVRRRAGPAGGAVRPDPQRDRPRLLRPAELATASPRAAGARLDRQAGALQGPPPGDRRLPARARARAGGAAADRRHGALRRGAARQAAELGDRRASVEFTSVPSDDHRRRWRSCCGGSRWSS